MNRNMVLTETPPGPAIGPDRAWMRRQPRNRVLWQVIGSLIVVLFLVVLARAIGEYSFRNQPQVTAVDPPAAMPGEILTMLGRDLGKSRVAEVYFTDGKDRWRAGIVHQSAKSIRVRIPANVGPGVLHFVLTTPGQPAQWIAVTAAVSVRATER